MFGCSQPRGLMDKTSASSADQRKEQIDKMGTITKTATTGLEPAIFEKTIAGSSPVVAVFVMDPILSICSFRWSALER